MKHQGITIKLTAVSALLLSLLACADDHLSLNPNSQSDDEMHFYSSIATETESRAEGRRYESINAEKCENSDIYLVTAIEDGIDGTKLATYDKDAEQKVYDEMSIAESRAAQLDGSSLVSQYLNKDGWGVDLYAYKYPFKEQYHNVDFTQATMHDVYKEFGGTSSSDIVKIIDRELLTKSSSYTSGDIVPMTTTNKHYWDAHGANRITFVGVFPPYSQYGQDTESTSVVLDDGKYSFATYAYDTNHASENEEYDGDPVFRYNASNDATKQIDFLYAQKSYSGNGGVDGNVSLEMKHIMTGVTVSLGEGFEDWELQKVTFSKLSTFGWFNFATGEWMQLKGQVYTREMSYDFGTTTGKTATSSADNNMFMVIPQTVGVNDKNGFKENTYIKIRVHRKGGTDSDTVSYSKLLVDQEWPMGKTVNYQLSNSSNSSFTEWYIGTDITTMKYGWNGEPAGNGTAGSNVSDVGFFRVKSYKVVTTQNTTASGTTETYAVTPLPFTVTKTGEGELNNGSTIEAIATTSSDYTDTSSPASGTSAWKVKSQGYGYNYRFRTYIGRQSNTPIASTEQETITSNYSTWFGEGTTSYGVRIDLSRYSQYYDANNIAKMWYKEATLDNPCRETSNCYMLQYPGYYAIPCVYGNAIHYGITNSNSYIPISANASYPAMGTLRKNDNTGVSDPWISGVTSAEVLWQDVNGLVTDLTIGQDGGKNFIFFTVGKVKDNFKPGNAVIVAKNSTGTILWSWHIWVTPHSADGVFSAQRNSYDVESTTTNMAYNQHYLNVPLGYVQHETCKWAARTQKVTLTQEGGNASVTLTLQQDEHLLPRVSCCYYQWGRKDPFPGFMAYENPNTGGAMAYDGTYTISTEKVPIYGTQITTDASTGTTTTVGGGIQNPNRYYTSGTQSGGQTSNRFPSDQNYYDLWGCTSNCTKQSSKDITPSAGTTGIKTIYDPSPIGFKVPPVLGMPAVTYDGKNWATEASEQFIDTDHVKTASYLFRICINTSISNYTQFMSILGYRFYKKDMIMQGTKAGGGTYVLNAFGNIRTDRYEPEGFGENVRYWTNTRWGNTSNTNATARNSRMFSMYLKYSSSGSVWVCPIYGNTESYGCPILPVWNTNAPVYYTATPTVFNFN